MLASPPAVSNTPFLLIPGLNSTPDVFRHLVPALWPLGPVSLANHTEGEGIAGIAAAILRDAPQRFALLGFSLGGYLAFEIIRQAPERVLKLCLLDTTARPDSPDATAKRRDRIAIARNGGFSKTLDGAYDDAVHPDHIGRADLRALSKAMSLAVGAETFIRQQEAIIGRVDSRPTLKTITVPTAVVVGDADAITPVEAAREMADGIAGARLTIIERAGHLAVLEQPEATAGAVVAWARGN
ncbi:MAG: alpha/beta fold hydrolase [Hyphomicrobiales bacterium]|nr:MAG: alpha/beta fold hydrolase [Hyphomicrobiales bacterium]